ncbi:MAG: Gfo/Idh/MocA family oxidoreductase [Planctomycetes bacterium]|nr:Gfo/Idh/MocA family oxidoreductase [Planctomycetota bacterium]
MLRVGLVGARRARQCLGPYLARFAEREGALVPAFAGASEAHLAETARSLGTFLGHEVRGYVGAAALLAGEALDALIVATPIEAHEEALEAALRAGVHVLCEKPMLWSGPGTASRALALVERFERAGLGLAINAQWPFTLPSYRALFPALDLARAERFAMRLSPAGLGASMLPDALPHALSLLQAARPTAEPALADPRIELRATDGSALRIAFTWNPTGAPLAVEVELVRCLEQPRPASYGFDERIAHRTIRLPAYELALEAEGRRVELPDPMDLLVKDFCRNLGLEGRMPRLEVQRLRALEALMGVFPRVA